MKPRSIVLYLSLALNVVLLVLFIIPRDDGLVFAATASSVGAYSGVSSLGGGNQDALWLANRQTGTLAVLQYRLGTSQNPVEVVGTRDLRSDLEVRNLGNLMLLETAVSSSSSVVFVIDTDYNRMAVYEYNRGEHIVNGIQKLDLTEVLGSGAAATTTTPAPSSTREY